MDQLLIASQGFRLGWGWFPPFLLHTGESVCLHVPGPAWGDDERDLLGVLTGMADLPEVRVLGRVEHARPAMGRPRLLGLIREPYPVDWLRRQVGVSRDAAERITARLHLKPEWRLDNLAGTPRTLLGLEAVWARGADALIFSTVGLDPLGRQTVFDAVRSHLGTCAAIYLAYPYTTESRNERDHLPGATCVDMAKSAGGPPLSLPA
jgi:hypothetical protein